ncbi:MAG: hypothetical protein AVDCRST_MAG70-1803, partial [uncultured Thermomicrobiales bacterium]
CPTPMISPARRRTRAPAPRPAWRFSRRRPRPASPCPPSGWRCAPARSPRPASSPAHCRPAPRPPA